MIRAINTAAGLMEYFLIFHVPQNLKLLSKTSMFMSESGFHVELAYHSIRCSDTIESEVI